MTLYILMAMKEEMDRLSLGIKYYSSQSIAKNILISRPFFFKKKKIYLYGCAGPLLWHASSLVAASRFSCSMWDLSPPTRNQTRIPYTGRWILNHSTTKEALMIILDS